VIVIFDKIVYPLLRKCNIKLNAIVRITCGFIIAAFGMTWSALVQHLIYSIGPNFLYAITPCSICQKFNNITVAWEIPSYFFLGIAQKRAFGSILNLSLISLTIDPQ
jgi:POT family proton-dependent oligopeptide transporter